MTTPRTHWLLRRGAMALMIVALLSIPTSVRAETVAPTTPAAAAAPGPVGHQGRWLTDDQGRVVYFNGVNLVAKTPGQTPADMGFGDDDAAFLVANGFDVVRLGTTAASLMPQPGVLDETYLDSFVHTIDVLTARGLRVLVDLHQDGWGPTLGSDGFPGWMTLTHGAKNTGTSFPLYYVTNPAIQAAFDSFWANEKGPDGVPLQDQVATMFKALAGRLAGHPGLLGYDLLNEPWPGTTWQACANPGPGCPAQDANLDAYHRRMTKAIRAEDPKTMIFGEPYVLFNFGQAPTTVQLPGKDPKSGLSFHVYTTAAADEPKVVDFAQDWTRSTGGALAITEFGATADVDAIKRQVDLFDQSLVPWMWWAYNENIVRDTSRPPTEANLVGPVVDTLVRPHPTAIAGEPALLSYDGDQRVLRFGYDSTRAGGGTFPAGTATEIEVAPRSYPDGYQVKVTNGHVTSATGASLLTVVADQPDTQVFVKVWAAGQPEPPDVAPAPEPVPTTTPTTPDAPPPAPTGPSIQPGAPVHPTEPGTALPATPLLTQAGYTG